MTIPHLPCPAVPPTAEASQCANALDQILSAPAASDQWGTSRGQIDHQHGPSGQFNTVSQPIFHLSATPSPHDQHCDPTGSSSEDPYHCGIPQIRAPDLDDLLSNPESLNQFFLDSSQSGTVLSFYVFLDINTATLGRADSCIKSDLLTDAPGNVRAISLPTNTNSIPRSSTVLVGNSASFYSAVAQCGAHFIHHAQKAMRYLSVDRPELSPPWCGLLRGRDQKTGIPTLLAQQYARWDPRYGLPFLHKYDINEGIISVDWFAGEECFHVIVHTMSEFNSPACIFVQEYRQINSDHGLELQIQDYLGRFSKSPGSNALTGVRMKHFRKVKAKIFHLLKSVDSCNVASLDSEDSQRALTGKLVFQQKLQSAINPMAVWSNIAALAKI
ncbi:hypothetical protein BDN67DRAFT_985662 [Paxillus ammoniavirescens]|nr:hypothetical protein BDN67DRAFT_985662 [Paxillus ammoniavirescens]